MPEFYPNQSECMACMFTSNAIAVPTPYKSGHRMLVHQMPVHANARQELLRKKNLKFLTGTYSVNQTFWLTIVLLVPCQELIEAAN